VELRSLWILASSSGIGRAVGVGNTKVLLRASGVKPEEGWYEGGEKR